MRLLRNCFALLCLLALCCSAALSQAQADSDISIVGSQIMNDVLLAVAESAAIDSLNIAAQGTARGLDAFCNGHIDIVVAGRAISAAEDLICQSNEVAHSEFLFAHKIISFAAHIDAPLACMSSADLNALLKTSSSNQASDWADFATPLDSVDSVDSVDSLPIVILAPAVNSLAYALADRDIAGDRLRNDVETYAAVAAAVAKLGSTAGALAILPFSPDLSAEQSIKMLAIRSAADADCVSPSISSYEAGLYPFGQSFYLYVNRARLAENEMLASFVAALTKQDAGSAIASFGFNPPSPAAYELNANMLRDPDATVSVAVGGAEFVIPEQLDGGVNISGAANAYQLLERVSAGLFGENAGIQASINAVGQAAGVASLCAAEIDIAILDSPPQTIDMSACAEGDVQTVAIAIGSHSTVLLGNAADQHSMCLSTAQIDAIWNASSTGAVTSWQDIAASMPDQPLTLFGLSSSDRYADILLQGERRTAPPIRRDTEKNYDALYRAAAVGNVAGSLTYMTWQDYQNVLQNQQANVRLVNVDGGAGCVAPSVESISSGAYPLTRPASLLANETSLADITVQSLLWSLFADDNWQHIEGEEFVGIARSDLPARRRQLQTLFSQAEAQAAANAAASAEQAAAAETTDDDSE